MDFLSQKNHSPNHLKKFTIAQLYAFFQQHYIPTTKNTTVDDLALCRQQFFHQFLSFLQHVDMSGNNYSISRNGSPREKRSPAPKSPRLRNKQKKRSIKKARREPERSRSIDLSPSTEQEVMPPTPPSQNNNHRRSNQRKAPKKPEPKHTFTGFVTPCFFEELKELAQFKPTFLDSYKFSKQVLFFPTILQTQFGEQLLYNLRNYLSNDHPFFSAANKFFLTQMTIPKIPLTRRLPTTNVWTHSPGLLRSFQAPIWKVFFHLENGSFLYPTQPHLSNDNIFSRTNLSKSYLLNPPFKDYVAQRSGRFLQPLRNHVQHIFELALQNQKVQAIMFPFYNKKHKQMPKWFFDLVQDPFVTPIFFLRPLIFLRGADLHLHGTAPFQLVILLFGFHSPVNLYVKNNLLGNFIVAPKLLTNCRNLFRIHSLSAEHTLFLSYMKNVLHFVGKAHDLYISHAKLFDTFPLHQPFSQFSIPANTVSQSNLLSAQQDIIHPFFLQNMLTIPPKLKRVRLGTKQNYRPLLSLKIPHENCWFCGDCLHSAHQCVRNPKFNSNVPYFQDIPVMKYILNCQPLILTKQENAYPNSQELLSYLAQMDTFAQNIILHAPPTQYFDNPMFSKTRLHWPYHLSAGKSTQETLNSFLGYNLHSELGPLKYPYLEFLAPPLSQGDNELVYEHIQKLLASNKIYRTTEKNIWMIAPIFVLQGYNSVMKWKVRLIHDFSFFTDYFKPVRFRMPTPAEIIVKFKNKLCISIDISAAFFNAFLRYSNLLGFRVKNPISGKDEYFAAQAPIFGHQLSPYICKCLLNFIQTHLERLNFLTALYMDDFLIAVADINENLTPEDLKQRANYTVELLTRCGIIVSPKIEIKPASYFLFIGKYFDTQTGIILPNSLKFPHICEKLTQVLIEGKATIKFLDSLRGKLFYHSNCFRNEYCTLFNFIISTNRKKLENLDLTNDKLYKKLYQTKINLTDDIYLMFLYFFQAIANAYFQPLTVPNFSNYQAYITVDASVTTGGAFFIDMYKNCEKKSFSLYPEISAFEDPSSTTRELLAVTKALRLFSPHLSQFKKILIVNDNKVNIQHILQTTPKLLSLRKLYIQFRSLLATFETDFDFIWIPREDLLTRVADTLSKAKAPTYSLSILIRFLRRTLKITLKNYMCVITPTHLSCFLPNNLHKLHKHKLKKVHIFILPPYTEFKFFQALLHSIKFLQIRFVFILPDFRTSLFQKLVFSFFPQAKYVTGLTNSIVSFPYSKHTFKLTLFSNDQHQLKQLG